MLLSDLQIKNNAGIKLLMLGDSGTGKTGSLASLVKAGFKLHCLFFEEKYQILSALLTEEEAANVEIQVFAEPQDVTVNLLRQIALPVLADKCAFAQFTEHAKGKEFFAAATNPQVVIVLDSLTSLTEAATNFIHFRSGKIENTQPKIGQVQSLVENFLMFLLSSSVTAHVVIIGHFDKNVDEFTGTQVLTPWLAGKKSGPKILSRVNNVLRVEVTSDAKNAIERTISAKPSKNFVPKTQVVALSKEKYGLDAGLAEIFLELMRGSRKI